MPVSEVIQDGTDGILVPMTSSDLLAKRIDHLLSDRSLRARLGASARTKALQFDHTLTLPKLCSLIEG